MYQSVYVSDSRVVVFTVLVSVERSLTTSPASPRQPPRYICIYVSIYLYLRRLRCNRNERNEPKRALCQSEQQILFFGHFAIRSPSRRPELKRRLLAATRPAPRSVGIVLRSSWSSWSRIRSLTVGTGATAFVFGGGGVAPIVHQSDNKSQKRCRWEPKSIREVNPKYIKKMKEVAVNQKEKIFNKFFAKNTIINYNNDKELAIRGSVCICKCLGLRGSPKSHRRTWIKN
ncbi:GD20267 [Drosophila simulans]|uniref:GD20267 n=1 Tax=Drosophila simulans TaxID=7240 RepID=B4QWE9_DROSI|nr:GD20267 [Drosophila simulans]